MKKKILLVLFGLICGLTLPTFAEELNYMWKDEDNEKINQTLVELKQINTAMWIELNKLNKSIKPLTDIY